MFDPLGLADAEQINALHAFGFGGRWRLNRGSIPPTGWRRAVASIPLEGW
jgi:hypothetical protein